MTTETLSANAICTKFRVGHNLFHRLVKAGTIVPVAEHRYDAEHVMEVLTDYFEENPLAFKHRERALRMAGGNEGIADFAEDSQEPEQAESTAEPVPAPALAVENVGRRGLNVKPSGEWEGKTFNNKFAFLSHIRDASDIDLNIQPRNKLLKKTRRFFNIMPKTVGKTDTWQPLNELERRLNCDRETADRVVALTGATVRPAGERWRKAKHVWLRVNLKEVEERLFGSEEYSIACHWPMLSEDEKDAVEATVGAVCVPDKVDTPQPTEAEANVLVKAISTANKDIDAVYDAIVCVDSKLDKILALLAQTLSVDTLVDAIASDPTKAKAALKKLF